MPSVVKTARGVDPDTVQRAAEEHGKKMRSPDSTVDASDVKNLNRCADHHCDSKRRMLLTRLGQRPKTKWTAPILQVEETSTARRQGKGVFAGPPNDHAEDAAPDAESPLKAGSDTKTSLAFAEGQLVFSETAALAVPVLEMGSNSKASKDEDAVAARKMKDFTQICDKFKQTIMQDSADDEAVVKKARAILELAALEDEVVDDIFGVPADFSLATTAFGEENKRFEAAACEAMWAVRAELQAKNLEDMSEEETKAAEALKNQSDEDVLRSALRRTAGVLTLNSFTRSFDAVSSSSSASRSALRLLFPLAARVNHSCAPNVWLRVRRKSADSPVSADNYVCEAIATRDVYRGEEICWNYAQSDASFLWGGPRAGAANGQNEAPKEPKALRQAYLAANHFISPCSCVLCGSDQSETKSGEDGEGEEIKAERAAEDKHRRAADVQLQVVSRLCESQEEAAAAWGKSVDALEEAKAAKAKACAADKKIPTEAELRALADRLQKKNEKMQARLEELQEQEDTMIKITNGEAGSDALNVEDLSTAQASDRVDAIHSEMSQICEELAKMQKEWQEQMKLGGVAPEDSAKQGGAAQDADDEQSPTIKRKKAAEVAAREAFQQAVDDTLKALDDALKSLSLRSGCKTLSSQRGQFIVGATAPQTRAELLLQVGHCHTRCAELKQLNKEAPELKTPDARMQAAKNHLTRAAAAFEAATTLAADVLGPQLNEGDDETPSGGGKSRPKSANVEDAKSLRGGTSEFATNYLEPYTDALRRRFIVECCQAGQF